MSSMQAERSIHGQGVWASQQSNLSAGCVTNKIPERGRAGQDACELARVLGLDDRKHTSEWFSANLAAVFSAQGPLSSSLAASDPPVANSKTSHVALCKIHTFIRPAAAQVMLSIPAYSVRADTDWTHQCSARSSKMEQVRTAVWKLPSSCTMLGWRRLWRMACSRSCVCLSSLVTNFFNSCNQVQLHSVSCFSKCFQLQVIMKSSIPVTAYLEGNLLLRGDMDRPVHCPKAPLAEDPLGLCLEIKVVPLAVH